MGESNAESTLRHEQIAEDIKRMKYERAMRRRQDHKQHTKKLTSNATEVNLNTDYYLYNNPDNKRLTAQPIPFLYDTGAAISMISSDPAWAWTNLRECLYHIGGCFEGPTFKDLMMGEYHGIITLDSGETARVIIPEAVQLPGQFSHSNLLANTPYLMAGHKYLSDLHSPQLKFKGGGQLTLEVNKGHNIFHILPISSTKETPHRIIYLHLDQKYDPPTFLNTALEVNCASRVDIGILFVLTHHIRV
jgi:hypothetical protein